MIGFDSDTGDARTRWITAFPQRSAWRQTMEEVSTGVSPPAPCSKRRSLRSGLLYANFPPTTPFD